MSKIFKYELKRLLLNKYFFSLILITGLYSYQILSKDIIAGVAYTAPFSAWSYGKFLASILPLLLITLLFFISFLYSNQEKQVKQLTFASTINPLQYSLVKSLVIVVGYIIISLFVIIISFIFYAYIFKFFRFADFIIPILITLFPGMIFIFGIGLISGSIQSNILYVLMFAVLLIGFLPLPALVDLYGGHFFSTYPITLSVGIDGEPLYTLPIDFLIGKAIFIISGVVMLFWGLRRYIKA